MDKYVVQRMVGEGSFGKVYKARRKFTGRTVAIKIINKVGKPQKEIDSLRQELLILKTLKHPNIVEMLESIETEKEFCVVMEYALGDLWEILEKDGKIPEGVVQSIAKQLVQALFYLHTNRIIHRDLKPQNVLLCADGVVKLCDFGFARAMSNNTTMLMSTKGTPLYMAPEMIQNNPYNHTADLWSLGIILFELYVSKPPFFTNNVYTLIKQIINNRITYPLGMSADFRSFLEGLLSKRWQKRLDWPHLLNHPFVRLTQEERAKQQAAMAECEAQARQPWPDSGPARSSGGNAGLAQDMAPASVPNAAIAVSPPTFKTSSSKAAYMPMTQRMQTVRRGVGVPRPRITEPNTALTAGRESYGKQAPAAAAAVHDAQPVQAPPQTTPAQHASKSKPDAPSQSTPRTSAAEQRHGRPGSSPGQAQQPSQDRSTAAAASSPPQAAPQPAPPAKVSNARAALASLRAPPAKPDSSSSKAVSEPVPQAPPMGEQWFRNAHSDRAHGAVAQQRAVTIRQQAMINRGPTAGQPQPPGTDDRLQVPGDSSGPSQNAANNAQITSHPEPGPSGALHNQQGREIPGSTATPHTLPLAQRSHGRTASGRLGSTALEDISFGPLQAHASSSMQHSASSPPLAQASRHNAAPSTHTHHEGPAPSQPPTHQGASAQQSASKPDPRPWSIAAVSPRSRASSSQHSDSSQKPAAWVNKGAPSADLRPIAEDDLEHLPNPLMPQSHAGQELMRKGSISPPGRQHRELESSARSPHQSPRIPHDQYAPFRSPGPSQVSYLLHTAASVPSRAASGQLSPVRDGGAVGQPDAQSPERPSGSWHAASPSSSPERQQAGESIIGKMLSHAEALAATAEGAAVMWRDAGRLAAVRDILRRPASGIAYTQWAGSVELRRATTVSCQLLRHRQDGSEAAATLQNSLLAAARAAAAVSPHGVAHIVAAVHAAEAAAAGEAPETFVTFEGTPQLYAEMLARPLKDGGLATTCCIALAEAISRAQVACSGNHSAEPSEAQALLEWAKDSNVLVRLLKCAEEPLDPSAGAIKLQHAAVCALASLVTYPAAAMNSQRHSQPFPLAQCLSHAAAHAHETAPLELPSSSLLPLVRERVAQELSSRKMLVQHLITNLAASGSEHANEAMQLLLGTCGCSTALCEAVCTCSIHKVLANMIEGSQSRCALLLLAHLASGLRGRARGKAPMAASADLLDAPAFDLLLLRLGGIMQGAQTDAGQAAHASAACHAAATLLDLSQHTYGVHARAPTPLLTPPVLAALRKLLGWVGGSRAAPFEGQDEEACCMGLLDGPAALCLALHAQAGAVAMQQSGLTEALVQLLASIARGVTPALSQLSPRGLLSVLKVVRLAVEASNNAGADLLLRQGITLALATLLRPAHLEALQPWPQRHGGARSGASVLIADVCGLLATPLAMARSRQGVVLRLQERMAQDGILGALIRGLPAARAEGEALSAPAQFTWDLMSFDAPAHHPFAHQFLQAGGLGADSLSRLLAARNSSRVLSPALHILNYLTCWGSAFVQPLVANCIPMLASLLRHRSGHVQIGACKLIGGLFRTQSVASKPKAHGKAAMGEEDSLDVRLTRAGVIAALVACLADEQGAARPTACYALGNIAFSSTAALHVELAPAIPHLVKLTHAPEAKPRSNSAGALGNLLRNSSVLCQAIISHGGLQALMTVAEEAGGAQDPGTGSKTRPADTALFALSQACLHQACREQLKLLGIHAVVDRVAKLHDASLATHCRSIQQRMTNQRGR